MLNKTLGKLTVSIVFIGIALVCISCIEGGGAVVNLFSCASQSPDGNIPDHCVVYTYQHICPNGTPAEDATLETDGTIKCASCDNDYVINNVNFRCDRKLSITQEPFSDGDPSANTATITFTTSDDAVLWWVVYTNGTSIGNTTTVIDDASGSGGLMRSGASGITIEGSKPYTVALGGLRAQTNYTFYLTIRKNATNEAVLSEQLIFATNQVGFPEYDNQPTITSTLQTEAKATLTASERTNLYWVVYDSEQIELTAAQVKTDATSGGGVDRSGPNTIATARQPIDFDITNLDVETPYYLYAAIEDEDGNIALSREAPFTTEGYPFVCDGGTPVRGTSTRMGVTNCAKCNNYYLLDGDTCVATVYTCTNGSVDPNYASKTPATETETVTNADIEKCGICNDYYRLDEDTCVATVYTCDGGTADRSTPFNDKANTKDADIEKCMSCDNPNESILNGACESFGFDTAPTTFGATSRGISIRLTASHDATLHWVVYADRTSKTDAATVVDEAKDDSMVVVVGKSGTTGMSLTGGTSATFFVSGDSIAAVTSYTAYVVITSEAQGTVRVLSDPLNFTTNRIGIPGFTPEPAASDPQQTTTEITLTADESTKLYWVLAKNEQAYTNEQLKAAATGSVGDNIVAISGSTESVTAHEKKTIQLSNLSAKTLYYFYALLVDDDNNKTASEMLRFSTIGYNYVCANGSPADGTTASVGVTICASCKDYFRKMEDDTCTPTVYTCTNGEIHTSYHNQTPEGKGETITNADIEKCGRCNDYYRLDDGRCVETVYTCTNGDIDDSYITKTPSVEGDEPKNADIEKCGRCDDYYRLDDGRCVETVYTCTNGDIDDSYITKTPSVVGDEPTNADIEKCGVCDDYFTRSGDECIATVYMCTNGTLDSTYTNLTPSANNDSVVDANVEKCNACDDYFARSGDECIATVYVCTNGTPDNSQSPAEAMDDTTDSNPQKCGGCHDYYRLDDGRCVETVYTCTNGTFDTSYSDTTPRGAEEDTKNADIEKCVDCNPYYKKSGDECIATTYVCTNGSVHSDYENKTPEAETETETEADIEKCGGCHDYYRLDDGRCVETVYTCTHGTNFDNTPRYHEHGTTDANVERCKECDEDYYKTANETCAFGTDTDGDFVEDSEDIDDDNDGLIEIDSLLMLHNMRYDLAGASYDDELDDGVGNEGDISGAPTAKNKPRGYVCGNSDDIYGTCGYELTENLSFDADGDGSTWTESNGGVTFDDGDSRAPYFDSANGWWNPIGDDDNPFHAFFEGNGNTITGIIVVSGKQQVGMFGAVANGSTIQNLTVADSYVISTEGDSDSASHIAVVAGRLGFANDGNDNNTAPVTIENVNLTGNNYVGGSVNINNIGGLSGFAQGVNIENSSSDVEINASGGNDIVGGLVGLLDNASINNGLLSSNGWIIKSRSSGNVVAGNHDDIVGGLVGSLSSSSIVNSSTTGTVSGGNGADSVGGLVGSMSSSLINDSQHRDGDIVGGADNDFIGGLVGQQINSVITKSYAPSSFSVNGGADDDSVGGLVGFFSNEGTIKNSNAVANINGDAGTDNAGGLVGWQQAGSIVTSHAHGAVHGGADNDNIGGLVGYQEGGEIHSVSYATGDVNGNEGKDSVGGLVGNHQGNIYASYATGAVNGGNNSDSVGGLVGHKAEASGPITASYATGDVNGDDGDNDSVGGLVGKLAGGAIIATYAEGNVDGGGGILDYNGGLVGNIASMASANTAVIASFATGNITDAGGTQDHGGALIGVRGNAPGVESSYGFGNIGSGIEIKNGINNSSAVDVVPATGKTAPDSASGLVNNTYFSGNEANYAWGFSTDNPPQLLYADYDGYSTDTTYSCIDIKLMIGTEEVTLTCGSSSLLGQ